MLLEIGFANFEWLEPRKGEKKFYQWQQEIIIKTSGMYHYKKKKPYRNVAIKLKLLQLTSIAMVKFFCPPLQ